MNEKTKKNLKKTGIVAGCVIGATGLLYAGYLAGLGFIHIPGIKLFTDIKPSVKEGMAFDWCVKQSLMPRGKCAAIAYSKDEAIMIVKKINTILQEVK